MDLSNVPTELLTKIDDHVAQMGLTPAQKLVLRSNLAGQHLKVKAMNAKN